jgi:regulator of RNase E activity RraA
MKLITVTFFLLFGLMSISIAQDSDQELLDLYEGLRVADVSDGMDMVGMRDLGLLDTEIEALWKDVRTMKHHFCGIAVTARYVPTKRIIKNPMEEDEFKKWEGKWYNEISPEPWTELIKEGSVVVLDVSGDGDVGSIGSANSLGYIKNGARGIVSNGGVRDTDEIILQEIPLYMDISERGRGIRPGRNELESYDKPITVGGVYIKPGDIIVADGDGVICVPREHAKPVALAAKAILTKDKEVRKKLYEQLGKELDKTVLP